MRVIKYKDPRLNKIDATVCSFIMVGSACNGVYYASASPELIEYL